MISHTAGAQHRGLGHGNSNQNDRQALLGSTLRWPGAQRDPKRGSSGATRMALAETRPELAAMFAPSSREASAEPGAMAAEPEGGAYTSSSAAPAAAARPEAAAFPGVPLATPGSDEQTRSLAGWVLEHILRLPDDELDSLEVEFKMGLLTDERTGRRRAFEHECVLDEAFFKKQRLRFKSDVGARQFESLHAVLDAAASRHDIAHDSAVLRDARYVLAYAPLGPGQQSVRVTSDAQGQVLECQAKQRIGDVHVALPHSAYDLKLSLSLERRVDAADFMPRLGRLRPRFARDKNRHKWTAPACEIDLTSVSGRTASGAAQATNEVEVETNAQVLAGVLREYRATTSPESRDKFLGVIRDTMDSARYLSHSV